MGTPHLITSSVTLRRALTPVTLAAISTVAASLLFCVAAASAEYRGPVKEVLIVHHSHLDVGYTHPQPMLWELQKDFLTQALNLLDETAAWPAEHQPRWTCEVTAPVMRWLDEASPSDVARFKKYLKQGRVAISALEYNTTPGNNAEGLARHLYAARALADRFGVKINAANTHDVTGLPWTVVDLLLDSDVELLIMGINLHLGGTPLPRPALYRWRGPSGRELLVLNGEHYSMFDQWAEPAKRNLDTMAQGLEKYLSHLERLKYPHDFAYLTATCAPQAYDNSPPNAELPRLVRQWNDAGRRPRLRFVTPPELLKRIRALPRESLPVVSGDWTDYWNFGAASSAWETRLARQTAADLAVIDLLQAFSKPDARLAGLTRRVWDDVNLYNEHTWGAAASLNPDLPNVIEQWALKAHPAYESRSLAEYVQARQLQQLAQNPGAFRKQEGVLVVNPTALPLRHAVSVPPLWRLEGKRIESGMMRGRESHRQPDQVTLCGPVELEPFSWRVVPIKQLKPVEPSPGIKTGADFIESPHHRLTFDPATGRITALLDKQRNWQALDPASAWGFFQLVHEKPDPRVEPSRKAFHVRSVENERVGLTGWKTNWVAALSSYTGKVSCRVEKSALAATLVLTGQAEGLTNLQQRITLRADSPLIELSARFLKLDVRSPEGLYFAFPLNLPANWRCHFDTAGVPTELDAEQIPGTCRDWVTVDSFASVHHGDRGATLYCPDAPMVQVGGFNFGRKQDAIPRRPNPLLLAWPMNNYWETNFRATQPGFVDFRYVFATHGRYAALRAVREGQQVANPPLVHPVMSAPQPRGGEWLQVKGDGVSVVYVKPAEDGRGIIVRLLNLNATPTRVELSFPGRKVLSANVCSAQEKNVATLKSKGASVACELEPRRLTTMRVQIAN